MLVFLVYHKIETGREGNIYTVSPTEFVRQLSILERAGVPILDPRVLCGPTGQDQRGVIFTFDDGSTDHFETVRPLLRDCGITALFYVSTSKLDRNGYLTSEQVRSLWEEGHTIGSHSHSHTRLDVSPREQVKKELECSAIAIDKIVGRRPVHFAPPGGFYNSMVQNVAQQVGYSFFRTMDWGYNTLFNPMRIEVVPMTHKLGCYFLKCALHVRLERTLKLACTVKNKFRKLLSKSTYNHLRTRTDRFTSRM